MPCRTRNAARTVEASKRWFNSPIHAWTADGLIVTYTDEIFGKGSA
jgi:hypothetical protein